MADLEELAGRVEGLSQMLGCQVRPFGESYAVTEDGSVWSCRRGAWAQLRPKRTSSGYYVASIIDSGKPKSVRVNRMVAEAFHGPAPEAGLVARHLNDHRADNRYTNIAWGTLSDNALDAVRNGRCSGPTNSKRTAHKRAGDLNPTRKLSAAQIPDIRNRLRIGESYRTIAGRYGVDRSAIYSIAKGKTWKST